MRKALSKKELERRKVIYRALEEYYGAIEGTAEIRAVADALMKNSSRSLGVLDKRAFNHIKANIESYQHG